MSVVLLLAGAGAWLVLVAQGCFLLAPRPWGAAMYFANVVVGRRFELTVMIGNHCPVPSQAGVALSVVAPTALKCLSPSRLERSKLEPVEVWSVPVFFRVSEECQAARSELTSQAARPTRG